MKKAEFVKAVAVKLEVTQKEASETLDKVFEVVQDSLVAREEVPFGGLGKFITIEKEERDARNPATGEIVLVPKHHVAKFKVGKQLKDAVR